MKITCSRRDDILRDKKEYEEAEEKYEKAKNQVEQRRRSDEEAAFEPVRKYLEDNLNKYDLLDFNIQLSRNWDWDRDSSEEDHRDSIEVRILCNDSNHFDDKVALSWNYDVKTVGGEVKAESSSWSGLKAVTAEQLESLKQTVSAIEFLQSVDWMNLLEKKIPDYMDYTKDLPNRPENRNFDSELLEADIEDSFGTGLGFPGYIEPEYESRWSTSRPVYYFFYGETPSQYRCVTVPAHYVDDNQMGDYDWKQNISRMKKAKVLRTIEKKQERVQVDSMKE